MRRRGRGCRVMSEEEALRAGYKILQALREHAAQLDVRIPDIKLRVGCPVVEQSHKESKRVVAHAFCRGNTVCIASGFRALTVNKMAGVLTHEVGHIMSNVREEGLAEPSADEWVRQNLGIEVLYDTADTVEFLNERTMLALGVSRLK